MYAIVQQGGHQYRVSPGDRLVVDRLEAEVGSVVALEPVLLVQRDGGDATVGSPVVDGARVAALVVSHSKGRKIRVFKYKAKKRYRRTQGHRSLLTELRIHSLLAAGDALPEAPEPAVVDAPEPVEAEAVAQAPAASKARGRRGAGRTAATDEKPASQAAEEELPSAGAVESLAEDPEAEVDEAPQARKPRRSKAATANAAEDRAAEPEINAAAGETRDAEAKE